MKFNPILTAIAVAGSLAFTVPAYADMDKAQVETVVHDYILKNPEVIAEAVQNLQQKQMDQMKSKGQAVAVKQAANLFKHANDPVAGNANGKVTLVEFFDYQCPHCVDMDPVVLGLIKANPNLRVVFKEFPIRGPVSMTAAKVALSANKQGKYMEMHEALMKDASSLTDAKIMDIAKQVGLDVAKLKTDMASADIEKQVKDTYQLAQELQLYGTPALFVAKTDITSSSPASAVDFVPGQVDQKYLQTAIDKANG
jgi:protein-disulfide isomerase